MPTGIGRRGIGSRAGIARRPIAGRYGIADAQTPNTFPAGSYTFTVPKTGYWRFVLWGGGANGATGVGAGGSGAYYEAVRYLQSGQSAAIVSGRYNTAAGSTVTLPGGEVLTALGSSGVTGAAASALNKAGDIAYAGSDGGTGGSAGTAGLGSGGGAGGAGNDGGAGAPGNLPFRGGAGGSVSGKLGGGAPGGGANDTNSASAQTQNGADGLVIVAYARD